MNFGLALRTLSEHRVEFVVVGGVAVVAHGASLMTRALDVLYRLDDENVKRLVSAFEALDAFAYGDPRKLRFRFDHLNNKGHHLSETKAGRVDALGAIGVNADILFETVIDDAVAMEAFGVQFHCLSLARLIAVKKELGRPRDKLAVMELEALGNLKKR